MQEWLIGVHRYINNGMKELSIDDKAYTGNGSVSANIPSGVKAVFWTAFYTASSTGYGNYEYGVNCTGHKGAWWGSYQKSIKDIDDIRLTYYARSGISIINR